MEQIATFEANFATQLQDAISADNGLPVRVWASDESRFGLHTIRRRRLTARGVKPLGIHQHRFENTWVFGAVEPLTGAGYFRELPTLNAAMMQQFLDGFSTRYADSLNVVLVDNAASHTARCLQIPANVRLVFQPPYSPEVNPCERVWQALKTAIAWTAFADLTALRHRLVDLFRSYTDDQLQSLTGYPYFIAAVTALSL